MTKQLLVAGLAAMLPFTFAAALPFAGQAGGADMPETASRNASKSKTAATDQIPEGTTIDVTLTKAIDAQRSKPGDEVDAKTSAAVKADGRVMRMVFSGITREHLTWRWEASTDGKTWKPMMTIAYTRIAP